MAFNFKTFKTRTLTAAVFVVVMLAGLLINNWTFFILFSIIHFGCWIEYQKLVGLIDEDYQNISQLHKYGIMIVGWCFMMWMTNNAYWVGHVELRGIGWFVMLVFTILLLAFEIVLRKHPNMKTIGYSLFGLLYISLSWSLMMDLRDTDLNALSLNDGVEYIKADNGWSIGWSIPLLVIFSIWINDTLQYIVGSFIGKTPFSKISPKKTWEGTIGGSVLCIFIIGYLVAPLLIGNKLSTAGQSIKGYHWYLIALITAVFGTMGDLLESKLKRMAGVKDSGQIMPGHGGFLDRFDSLLLATPFVWLYVHLFLK